VRFFGCFERRARAAPAFFSRPLFFITLPSTSPTKSRPLTLSQFVTTATIAKLAKDILARSTAASASPDAPPLRLTTDGVVAATACASEFVRLLAGEAAEAATAAGKNTIMVRRRRGCARAWHARHEPLSVFPRPTPIPPKPHLSLQPRNHFLISSLSLSLSSPLSLPLPPSQPDHVLAALASLGFDAFVASTTVAADAAASAAVAEREARKGKGGGGRGPAGMSEEEAIALQQSMLAAARERAAAAAAAAVGGGDGV